MSVTAAPYGSIRKTSYIQVSDKPLYFQHYKVHLKKNMLYNLERLIHRFILVLFTDVEEF